MSSRRGFSLLEVLVSITVLLVAIFGTLGAIAVSSDLRFSSHRNEQANQAMHDILEQYRSLPRDQIDDQALLEADVPLYSPGATTKPLGASARKSVYVLSERECRRLLPTDTNYDNAVDAADTFDLDGDATFDEGAAGSDRTVYASQRGQVVPIVIRIQWGRPRPVSNKPVLAAIQDAAPTAAQVLGTADVTREHYLEVFTFLYPSSTGS